MKWVGKTAYVLSRICEVLLWVAVAVVVVSILLSFFAVGYLDEAYADGTLTVEQTPLLDEMPLAPINADGTLNGTALACFLLLCLPLIVLMALVFHEICGAIKLTRNGSPFQPAVVRKVRHIGYFYAAGVAVGFVLELGGSVLLGASEGVINLGNIVTAFIILWLTQVFSYGAELQNDVDGLL